MNGDPVLIEVRPYDRALVRRTKFSCGKPDLDEWFRLYAGQQERQDNTRTFLAVAGGDVVAGYYATTAYQLDLDEVASALGAGKRRYPVPAVLLARLAVDRAWQGCGIGKQLLIDAVFRLAEASKSVGFEVVVVDAIDDEAVTFYARFGFQSFVSHQRRLFMPTASLRATVEAMPPQAVG